MQLNDVDALESLIRMRVADMHPSELRELVESFPEDETEAVAVFCDRLDLGDWIYESILVHINDLGSLLYQIAEEFESEIKELQEEENLINALMR